MIQATYDYMSLACKIKFCCARQIRIKLNTCNRMISFLFKTFHVYFSVIFLLKITYKIHWRQNSQLIAGNENRTKVPSNTQSH